MTPARADTLLADPYLNALASPQPTPGGGSATAVTAATGVSLLEMVARLSQQSADPERSPALGNIGDECQAMRRRLTELGAEDERAYGGFRDALSLPKETPEEKARRREALQHATIASANAPLDIADIAVHALEMIPQLAAISSPYLRSDLDTAAYILAGAAHGAIVMVDTNLGSIKDATIQRELTERRDRASHAVDPRLSAARQSSA